MLTLHLNFEGCDFLDKLDKLHVSKLSAFVGQKMFYVRFLGLHETEKVSL